MNKIVTRNKEIESAALFALEYLGVDGVTVTVSVNSDLLQKLSTPKIAIEAMTYPTEMVHSYLLVIDSPKPRNETIFHEMAHLKQYEDGRLSYDYKTHVVRWLDQPVGNIPYFSREWELEAFDIQNRIKRIFNTYQNEKNRPHQS